MSDNAFEKARILLCVSGGIAAYKAAALTSTLIQKGAIVDVALTPSAQQFITPLTFSALTGREVYTSLWESPETIPHIRLVREAQVALIAPATAEIIAKLAQGRADDLVTTALLAARIPIVLAPAMNDAMYSNPATQANVQTLRDRGYEVVEPEHGFLAERESGVGRLASEDAILAVLQTVLARSQSLAGKQVLITAGPTREPIDPVRFISNPSTGATGIALAREAALRGAEVTLILGPTQLQAPHGVRVIQVTTAQEMHDAALAHAKDADLVIATAAVSDWRPQQTHAQKMKKGAGETTVSMTATPDILAEIASQKNSAVVVGFAAETENHEANAREKLVRKKLDAIAVNDVSEGRGFGLQRNALTLLWGTSGKREIPLAAKEVLAARLLDSIEHDVIGS